MNQSWASTGAEQPWFIAMPHQGGRRRRSCYRSRRRRHYDLGRIPEPRAFQIGHPLPRDAVSLAISRNGGEQRLRDRVARPRSSDNLRQGVRSEFRVELSARASLIALRSKQRRRESSASSLRVLSKLPCDCKEHPTCGHPGSRSCARHRCPTATRWRVRSTISPHSKWRHTLKRDRRILHRTLPGLLGPSSSLETAPRS